MEAVAEKINQNQNQNQNMCQMKNFTSKGIFHVIGSATDQVQIYLNLILFQMFDLQIIWLISIFLFKLLVTMIPRSFWLATESKLSNMVTFTSFDLKHQIFFCIELDIPGFTPVI